MLLVDQLVLPLLLYDRKGRNKDTDDAEHFDGKDWVPNHVDDNSTVKDSSEQVNQEVKTCCIVWMILS